MAAETCPAKPIPIGAYVLATKYTDGDPLDQWSIGFYSGYLNGRHYVVDNDGLQFRGNGFRRVRRITRRRGNWMLQHVADIEGSARSVWYWASARMKETP